MDSSEEKDVRERNSPLCLNKLINCPSRQARIPRHLRSAPIRRLQHSTEKSVTKSFVLSVLSVMFAIVVGVPLMLCTGILYPFALFLRTVITNCCCCPKIYRWGCWCVDSTATMLSATDVMWLQDKSSGQSIISCLLFLERGLDLNAIRDLVFHRVIQAVHEDGRRMYPRLVQRIIPASAGYYWVEDDNFNIDNHIVWAPVHVRTKSELQSFVGALIEQPLPSGRPLWEMRVIPYFDKNRETVLFFRIHHCITDGTSLVKLLVHSLADGQLVPNAKPRFGGTAFPLNVFRALIIGPVTFFSWLFFTCQDHNFFRRKKKIADNSKVVAWSHDINLPKVTRIKQVTRSTLNDVILGALTGSLRNVLRSHGIKNPYDLKINITIDLRYEPKHGRTWVPMGTEFSLANVKIPTNTEGVIPQLWEVRSRLEELKTSADSVVMYGAIHVLFAFLPMCLAQWLVNCILSKASLLFSNIAGPEVPLQIGAHQLKSVVFWMPPRDNVPIALSVFTYSDTLKMSVVADKEILPNPQPIITEFVAQISKMSKLLASRRTPGESRRRSFLVVGREDALYKPPVEELQQKLHDVQDELHAITQRMDAATLVSPSPDQLENAVLQQELFARVAELKEQFTDLLSELRRRKSLADGIPFGAEEDDDDMDGEVRRPRKRALSISSSRKSSISIMSTTRPLATTPTSSHHSVLSHSADSEPSSSPTQEQQRALLETEQETKRRQLAEAAEKRFKEQESRGIKDPQRLKEQLRKKDQLERNAEFRAEGEGLRWQLG